MGALTYNERVQDGLETAVNCQRLMVGVDAEDTLNNAQIGLQCVQLQLTTNTKHLSSSQSASLVTA